MLILIDPLKRRAHLRKGDRRPIMYWDRGWNIFDFTIVTVSVFDTFFLALGLSNPHRARLPRDAPGSRAHVLPAPVAADHWDARRRRDGRLDLRAPDQDERDQE